MEIQRIEYASKISFGRYEELSKFFLYLGIFLACSGIGTVAGILMIVFYFWDDVKKTLQRQNYLNSQESNSINQNPKFYDENTAERMR